MIYLDYHSSTPVFPEVWEAMQPFATETYGNPSSAHAFGRKARQALEDARERMAAILDAFPDELIFTSGATEANNLALFGLSGTSPGRLLASPMEHPCVTEPLRQLERRGFTVDWLQTSPDGIVDDNDFLSHLQPETRLASVMRVNHETGAIQPVAELANACAQHGIAFHCDAAQAVGKIHLSFRDLGVTTMSLSAHKFHGPKGIGALLVQRCHPLQALLFGGHQQKGRRPGTEPVALVVGMARALELVAERREAAFLHVARLKQRFVEQLCAALPDVHRNGPEDLEHVSPYAVNLSFPGCRAELLLMKLDLAGVACSTGSACSSGSLLPSPVLQAMHVPEPLLRSAMRFSFSPALTLEDIEEAARRIIKAVKEIRTEEAEDFHAAIPGRFRAMFER